MFVLVIINTATGLPAAVFVYSTQANLNTAVTAAKANLESGLNISTFLTPATDTAWTSTYPGVE